jgi:hypothetical protein
MKLRLKYYKITITMVLWIGCLVIPFVFVSSTTLSSNKDLMWLILWGLSLLYTVMRLGYMILFEFYQVEFTKSSITLKNIITQKQTVIETYIASFKINLVNGKFTLIDQDGDVVAVLNAFHYFNVPEAIEYLGLKRN